MFWSSATLRQSLQGNLWQPSGRQDRHLDWEAILREQSYSKNNLDSNLLLILPEWSAIQSYETDLFRPVFRQSSDAELKSAVSL